MRKVLILDTSILCVWLKVPGKETCGSGANTITYDTVHTKIEEEVSKGTTFILPIAAIIETGNHIAQSNGDRFAIASSLVDIINKTAEGTSPWAAFTVQSELWKPNALKDLAIRWNRTVVAGQSLGDASIVDVANYYYKAGYDVEIYTGDEGLKSYEPLPRNVSQQPRRRRG